MRLCSLLIIAILSGCAGTRTADNAGTQTAYNAETKTAYNAETKTAYNAGTKTGYNTAAEVAEACTSRSDPYKKTTTTRTPSYKPNYAWTVFLRRVGVQVTDEVRDLLRDLPKEYTTEIRQLVNVHGHTYQVYFSYSSSDWSYFHSAYDDQGNKLKFVPITRDVGRSGRIREDFALTVDRPYLNSHAATGLTFGLYPKGNNPVTIHIPPHYIQGFLSTVEVY